jgi:hypothetical protein
MLKCIISVLLIALSLVATMFPTVSFACSTSERTDCTSPKPVHPLIHPS